jgi:SRSO17 transposase
MDLLDETGTEARFQTYAADLALVLGHADRLRLFQDCCVGLLSAERRGRANPSLLDLMAATSAAGTARTSGILR